METAGNGKITIIALQLVIELLNALSSNWLNIFQNLCGCFLVQLVSTRQFKMAVACLKILRRRQ